MGCEYDDASTIDNPSCPFPAYKCWYIMAVCGVELETNVRGELSGEKFRGKRGDTSKRENQQRKIDRQMTDK